MVMKEYELTLTVKNAILLNIMRARGIKTAAHLSRECGISQGIIGKFLNMSESPYSKRGEVKKDATKMADYFGLDVEFLFPADELYLALDKNTFTAQVSKTEMVRLSGSCPSIMLEEFENESSEPFNGMLEDSRLTTREKLAIKLKYKDGLSLKEIGEVLGDVSRSRAAQIIEKALRKLRGDVYEGLDFIGIAGKYNNLY
jgi:RNA polymerase sigma factor (sigma-70 family)